MENGTAIGLDGTVDASSLDDTSLDDASLLSDTSLLSELERGFGVRHAADSRLVVLTAEVVHRSRASLGPDGLALRFGSTSAAALLTEVGRITLAEGQRFCRVAGATAVRLSLVGERMPPSYPLVADAVRAAVIPIDSAHLIVAALSQASPRAERGHLEAAELALVRFAAEHPADLVRRLAVRWRDALDIDGIEPREAEQVERRSLRRSILANGLKRYRLDLDPVGSAYLDAAIDSQVSLAIRAPRFTPPNDFASPDDFASPNDCASPDDLASHPMPVLHLPSPPTRPCPTPALSPRSRRMPWSRSPAMPSPATTPPSRCRRPPSSCG